MAPVTIALIAAVVVLVLVALYVVLTYNRLVALRLACQSSWGQIDVALKLRHDLVPNLVAAVSGYATHERAALERVTEARAAAVAADDAPAATRGAAEAVLAQGLGTITAIVEAYPDLQASASFRELQSQLVKVEDQLQITRRVYNDTVETYNTKVQSFPSMLVARPLHFEPREFFSADVGARVAPAVTIGGDAA